MRTPWMMVLLGILAPGVAWADAATVAAALPTAAAETRYLRQLCTDAQTAYRKATAAVEGTGPARSAGDSAAAARLLAESSVQQRVLHQALDDWKAATAVVRAKRGTLPPGTDACPLR